jgi:hypothetical protein
MTAPTDDQCAAIARELTDEACDAIEREAILLYAATNALPPWQAPKDVNRSMMRAAYRAGYADRSAGEVVAWYWRSEHGWGCELGPERPHGHQWLPLYAATAPLAGEDK